MDLLAIRNTLSTAGMSYWRSLLSLNWEAQIASDRGYIVSVPPTVHNGSWQSVYVIEMFYAGEILDYIKTNIAESDVLDEDIEGIITWVLW